MKFEMTRCTYCGSEMLMGLTVCPSCGKEQRSAAAFRPQSLLMFGLALAVLFIFNWLKPAPPQTNQNISPPSAAIPSR